MTRKKAKVTRKAAQQLASRSTSRSTIGKLAFIVGLIIASVIGLFSQNIVHNSIVISVVLLLGLIAGLVNISAKETTPFLVASLSLIVVAYTGSRTLDIAGAALVGDFFGNMLKAIMLFVVPASVVVALRAIYILESD